MPTYVTEVRGQSAVPKSFPGKEAACLFADSERELEAAAKHLKLPLAWQARTEDSHELPYYLVTPEQRQAALDAGSIYHVLCRGLVLGRSRAWHEAQWEKREKKRRSAPPRSKLIPDEVRALFVKKKE